MDWSRFLKIARCPALTGISAKPCYGTLTKEADKLICGDCQTSFSMNDRYGFPLLILRTPEEARADRYEDPDNRHAEHYAGIWAFGYHFQHLGEAEGFYRTLSDLVCSPDLQAGESHAVLEVGCGVGRTAYDAARHYPDAFVVGVDISQRMLEQAYRIVVGDPANDVVEVSLEAEGMGTVAAKSFRMQNVFFTQASALQLPFDSACFDVVVSANLIDRMPDPHVMVREARRVLKPGGALIIADPFNWSKQPAWWNQCVTLEQFISLLEGEAFVVEEAFDGLVYREILDARGAHWDWPVAVARARKPA